MKTKIHRKWIWHSLFALRTLCSSHATPQCQICMNVVLGGFSLQVKKDIKKGDQINLVTESFFNRIALERASWVSSCPCISASGCLWTVWTGCVRHAPLGMSLWLYWGTQWTRCSDVGWCASAESALCWCRPRLWRPAAAWAEPCPEASASQSFCDCAAPPCLASSAYNAAKCPTARWHISRSSLPRGWQMPVHFSPASGWGRTPRARRWLPGVCLGCSWGSGESWLMLLVCTPS